MTFDEIYKAVRLRLNISQLNEMQLDVAQRSKQHDNDIIIYSPTGSGKTLALAFPLLYSIKNNKHNTLQAIIISPSRELVIQLYDIIRQIATDIKVSACYGGHNSRDESKSLATTPTILISTPGRLLDHVSRGNIDIRHTSTLVLDEFDKSLELGFENELSKIFKSLTKLNTQILSSATTLDTFPPFVSLKKPLIFNYLHKQDNLSDRTTQWVVTSPEKDKLYTLRQLLPTLPEGKTIVFAGFRDAVKRIHDFLSANKINNALYHGELQQIEREKAIALFNNGTHNILISTDLGSRGLDIENVKNIIHYHLPINQEAWIHRNGRTARVNKSGNIFIILSKEETLPHYIDNTIPQWDINRNSNHKLKSHISTLHFAAGKKEKLSKGDIVGFMLANASEILQPEQIGKINIADHYSLVAVPTNIVHALIEILNKQRIKSKKVKITIII